MGTNPPGYTRRHKIVVRKRGRAAEYCCIMCNEEAHDWAQIHGSDPDNIYSYCPMCKSCHIKYDYTDEWRAKVAIASTGRKQPQEARQRTIAAHTGSKRSPEARARMSAAQTKRWARTRSAAE